MPRISKIVQFIFAAWVLPAILFLVVYHAFTTNYTSPTVFTEQGFQEQYGNGIYKYRIVGNALLLTTYHALLVCNCTFVEKLTPKFISAESAEGLGFFYAAYFIDNTFFFLLTCSVLYILLWRKVPDEQSYLRLLMYLVILFLIALTQYVITPYDTLTYFCLLTAIFLILGYQSPLSILVLVVILFIGTLTRETAAVIPAFYLTINLDKILARSRIHLLTFLLLTGVYLGTYLALRFALGFDEAFFKDVRVGDNLLTFDGLAGFLFFATLVGLLIGVSQNKRLSWLFLITTLPYTAFIVFVGYPWEIRLWVPVFIPLVLLAGIAREHLVSPVAKVGALTTAS